MPPLHSTLRKQLETAVTKARPIAEQAASDALTVLGAQRPETRTLESQADRDLRTALRAKAKILGSDGGRDAGWTPLIEEIAYQQWHRMLFARFLAENNLLFHPSGVAVSLDDCAEIARDEGIDDRWEIAARYAAAMLPGLFRADNPTVQIRFAPEGQLKLEKLLSDMPVDIFTSDDGLGWVYQFWQKEKKDQINASGKKIGAAEIGPVTQLFTEDYMVRFLLENSLGAWWAARHPQSPLLKEWDYLRFNEDGTPAAGSFPGWPERVAEVTVMDPCCGSGHFLVAAFDMLRKMRMEEEGLTAPDAADAVLRDNLFGLEIDPRCTQIATFAVALAAWKAGGHPDRNPPQIACSGIAAGGTAEEWARLGGNDDSLRYALAEMHRLFKDAPTLGSLIDPLRSLEAGRAFQSGFKIASWQDVGNSIAELFGEDSDLALFTQSIVESARAGTLLGKTYTLVITNVPYLTRGKFGDELRRYTDTFFSEGSADLATCFVLRCLSFCEVSGLFCVVLPQNWLSLEAYKSLRSLLLETTSFQFLCTLGAGAFRAISGQVVKASLVIASNKTPKSGHKFASIGVSSNHTVQAKDTELRTARIAMIEQAEQSTNRSVRISLVPLAKRDLLGNVVGVHEGMSRGDTERFDRKYWELSQMSGDWSFLLNSPQVRDCYQGREHIVRWEGGNGDLGNSSQARITGTAAWGLRGIFVARTSDLKSTISTGEMHAQNGAVLVPRSPSDLAAVWAFCSSPEFSDLVKQISDKIIIASGVLADLPFDKELWQMVAEEKYPDGLPDPHSDDPTQWLFKGNIVGSESPLQVAVSRLLGYRWPDQPEDALDALTDRDGIVPLPSLRGEPAAAERLRALLAAAYGDDWSPALLDRLLAEVGFGGKTLAEWLSAKTGFFAQHTKLFHQRPFIWQITDGEAGGFSALLNYHKFDAANLDRLIHSYLGRWIEQQQGQVDANAAGAEGRLAAAEGLKTKLEKIQTGEAAPGKVSFDIYVRWKPLAKQPIGWEPDLNDGVRLNIRPFVTAGILRAPVNAKWGTDRGANPVGSDVQKWAAEARAVAANKADWPNADGAVRVNDLHLTRATKLAARAAAGN